MQTILGGLDHDNEFLAHLRTNFEGDLLLELFGNGVFDEPAVEFDFRVLDERAILVLERQLVPVVLAEYLIAIKLLEARYLHVDDLLLIADVGQQKSRSKNLTANKLAIINDVRIDVKDLVDVDYIGLLLSFSLNWIL